MMRLRRKRLVKFPALAGVIAAPPQAYASQVSVLDESETSLTDTDGRTVVIDVCGPLVQHPTSMGAYLGTQSYVDLREAFDSAVASAASVIVLRVDSPGGDFAGCLELARYMRETARDAGKRLVAFTDSNALSAAYALACSATEIVLTPSAMVGSAGVWAPLIDETVADRARGLNFAIVASGSQKAERNSHVPITEASVANLQAEIDAMAELLFSSVGEWRGLPAETVASWQGGQLMGSKAVANRFADRVVNDWTAFYATIGESQMGMKEARAAYRSALAKLAAEEGDDSKAAVAALASLDKDAEKQEAKAAEKDEPAEASDETEEPKSEEEEKKDGGAKAESEEEPPVPEKKEQAKAGAVDAVALAERIHKLEAERAAEKRAAQAKAAATKIATERAALLATRPDFGAQVRETLASASLDVVKRAVETWPRVDPTGAALEAYVPNATRGDTQKSPGEMPRGAFAKTEAEYIAERMAGPSGKGVGIVRGDKDLTLGFMTKGQARAALSKESK